VRLGMYDNSLLLGQLHIVNHAVTHNTNDLCNEVRVCPGPRIILCNNADLERYELASLDS